jgi:hypothetical protein
MCMQHIRNGARYSCCMLNRTALRIGSGCEDFCHCCTSDQQADRTCSSDCRSSASGSPVFCCGPVKYPFGPRRLLLAGTTPNDMAPLPALPALQYLYAQASTSKLRCAAAEGQQAPFQNRLVCWCGCCNAADPVGELLNLLYKAVWTDWVPAAVGRVVVRYRSKRLLNKTSITENLQVG